MNREHLGDALDHWKGSLICLLQNELVNLHVLPMIPKRRLDWTPDHFIIYARLLGVRVEAILNRDSGILPKQHRDKYFGVCSSHDLFIDPDNGIGNDRGGSDQHITRFEVAKLIPENSGNLLLVYQTGGQRGNGKVGYERKALTHLREITRLLKEVIGEQCVFAYFGGQTSMIFVSRNSRRIARVFGILRNFLRSISTDRLIGAETLAPNER
jgi:hypothetical protein